MHWSNKGHELDNIAKKIPFKKFILYGAGKIGKSVYKDIKWTNQVKAFCDRNWQELKTEAFFHNVDIIDIDKLLMIKDEVIVILCIEADEEICNLFRKLGFEENRDFFRWQSFLNYYFPIYTTYYLDKLFLRQIEISITDVCTLRCKNCCNFMPYVKNPKHRGLEDVLTDVAVLFEKVDYIERFIIYGGEPFIYPKLTTLIEHLSEEYAERVGKIVLYTNGTVILKKELVDTLKKFDVMLVWSVYKNLSSEIQNRQKEFERIVNQNDISLFKIDTIDWWNDYGFFEWKNNNVNMENFVTICNSTCRGYLNGKMIWCVQAMQAGLVIKNRQFDIYNCLDLSDSSKKEIMEFNLGYLEGVPEMCNHCRGSNSIKKIPVAEQL